MTNNELPCDQNEAEDIEPISSRILFMHVSTHNACNGPAFYSLKHYPVEDGLLPSPQKKDIELLDGSQPKVNHALLCGTCGNHWAINLKRGNCMVVVKED